MVGVVQFRRIGSYSMIGGLCAVDMDVSPFTIASGIDGSRAYINAVNIIGMKRKGFSKEEINCASETLKSFFNDTDTYQKRLQKLQLISSNKVNNIIKDFLLKETKNGICHPKSLL
jgi:UDP-N-acetylglucosamine acyltransferase